jgi:hypothetical protein
MAHALLEVADHAPGFSAADSVDHQGHTRWMHQVIQPLLDRDDVVVPVLAVGSDGPEYSDSRVDGHSAYLRFRDY